MYSRIAESLLNWGENILSRTITNSLRATPNCHGLNLKQIWISTHPPFPYREHTKAAQERPFLWALRPWTAPRIREQSSSAAMAPVPTAHVNFKMKGTAFPPSTPDRSSVTYAVDPQSPSARRWFLSVPGGPWTVAVVGDGEGSESRLLVGVSSLAGWGLSPREGKEGVNFQILRGEKNNSTNNYTVLLD